MPATPLMRCDATKQPGTADHKLGNHAPDQSGHLSHQSPCQVLAGQHDPLRPPAEVAATAACIHGAEYAVVESGHLMAVQAPGIVAAALRVLQTRITEA